ncbi:Uncharacterised protein [uncultured archaeon]|nr:Uncharacterised protein [uncultured archaeon]
MNNLIKKIGLAGLALTLATSPIKGNQANDDLSVSQSSLLNPMNPISPISPFNPLSPYSQNHRTGDVGESRGYYNIFTEEDEPADSRIAKFMIFLGSIGGIISSAYLLYTLSAKKDN